MSAVGARYLIKPLTSALLALLGCCVIASTVARADCGDYVHFNAGTRQLVGQAEQDAGNHLLEAKPTLHPLRHNRPCQGPECSQGRVPTPEPLASVRLIVEHWGCPTPPTPLPANDSGVALAGSAVCEPDRSLSTIFHPPR
jgi:hypothetical protein